MDFERSTQSRSWLFDEQNLFECREMVTAERLLYRQVDGSAKVRNFASGFFRRHNNCNISNEVTSRATLDFINTYESTLLKSLVTPNEQDILVRFHAHQLTMLIGPYALLPSLVRSSTVLATAIIFFRRFYLSNSILDFRPRRIAVAAAFLAAKVEEQKVQVSKFSF